MSNIIYQLLEDYKDFDASQYIPKDPILTNYVYEHDEDESTFKKWGSAVGWGLATKAITGVKQSEIHKKRRAESKSREIEIEGITYKSGVEASKILGYHTSTISVWAKNNGSRYGISIPKGHNQYTHGKNISLEN